jgi:hypothetical protein
MPYAGFEPTASASKRSRPTPQIALLLRPATSMGRQEFHMPTILKTKLRH